MGNAESKKALTTSQSIEQYWINQARQDMREAAPLLREWSEITAHQTQPHNSPPSPLTPSARRRQRRQRQRHRQQTSSSLTTHSSHPIPLPDLPRDTIEAAATYHLATALRALTKNIDCALALAIQELRKLGIPTVLRVALRWVKQHPYQSATLMPLVLMALTPIGLGAVGFTAGGVAVGSIAAGIQAGIGSVTAGSLFATLTSAAMMGYGLPIVLAGVWGISSAVCWGVVAWRKWWGGSDEGGDEGEEGVRWLLLENGEE